MRIRTGWTKLHNELVGLKEIFSKNGYPEDFINKFFKKFMNNTRVAKENCRIGEHIGISPPTRKQIKPKNSFVADHLLLCNHAVSYDDFSIQTRENKKFLPELKESLLIMRDKPSLNRNITSAPLHLFDKA